MNTAETTILSGFWEKNGLGPLGVNFKIVVTPKFRTLDIYMLGLRFCICAQL